MSQFHDEAALHPTQGVRLLLERTHVSDDSTRAEYRAVIFTPEDHFEYRATLAFGGGVELTPGERPATDEHADKLAVAARLIARSAARKQSDGLDPWPHRVLRWRGPGR